MTRPEHDGQASNAIVPVQPVSAAGLDTFNAFGEPLGAVAGNGQGGSIRVVDLKQLLYFKWTMIGVFGLVFLPAVIGIWTLVNPKFTAHGEILVRPIIPTLVFRTEENGMIPLYESYKNTQVAIILGPNVLQRVLDNPDVQNTDWYKKPEDSLMGKQAPPLERLKNDIEVHPRGQTEIVDVMMTTRNSKDAAIIVNAVLEEYIKFVRESSDSTKNLLSQKLAEEYDSLRTEIQGREKRIAQLYKDLGTSTPNDLVSQKRVRLDEMEAKLQALDQDISLAVWQVKQIEELAGVNSHGNNSSATQPTPELQYSFDEQWRQLYMANRTAQHEYEMLLTQLGKEHPRSIDAQGKIAFTKEQLKERKTELSKGLGVPKGGKGSGSGFLADKEVQKHRIKQLQYERELLYTNVEKERTSFKGTLANAQLLAKENDDVRQRREMYDAIRVRKDEKEMERKVPGSIEINSQAIPSTKPSSDRRFILTLMALMGGIACGVGTAFLRVTLNPMIQEPEDLTRATQAPFLGRLPLVDKETESRLEDCPIQSEFIRMIRTSLLQRLSDRRGSTILITSAVPGEGKTTTAIMLAKSLAMMGKKVLLVDADLRNPALSQRYWFKENASAHGQARGLTGEGVLETEIPGLQVLPMEGFRNDAHPEFFSNGKFSERLNQWRGKYDAVIMDTCPVLPVADARILSRQADGTILVVREGHCHREEAKEALACLSVSGAKLLGTIYIGVDRGNRYGAPYYHNTYKE